MSIKKKLLLALAVGVVAVAGVTVGTLGYMYKEVQAFDQVLLKALQLKLLK